MVCSCGCALPQAKGAKVLTREAWLGTSVDNLLALKGSNHVTQSHTLLTSRFCLRLVHIYIYIYIYVQ